MRTGTIVRAQRADAVVTRPLKLDVIRPHKLFCPLTLGATPMSQQKTTVSPFMERMVLWLPGLFSVVLLIFSVISTPLFVAHSSVQVPDYIVYLLLGALGVLVHAVLLRQQRRISALESAALESGPYRPS